MKRLPAMQDWPLFWVRAVTAVVDGAVEVGARHHDERVGAAELEHGLLDLAPRRCDATERPAGSEPVRVTALTRGSSMTACDLARADQQRRERALGESAAREQGVEVAAPTAGTFEACFSTPALPAISAGAANRIDLPERVVPRHDREHDAERLVAGVGASRRSTDRRVVERLVGEELLGVLGVEAHALGALEHLGAGLRRSACPSRASSSRRSRRRSASSRSAAARIHSARWAKVVPRSAAVRGVGQRDAGARPRRRRAASNSFSVSPVAGLMVAMAMVLLGCSAVSVEDVGMTCQFEPGAPDVARQHSLGLIQVVGAGWRRPAGDARGGRCGRRSERNTRVNARR